MINEVNKRKLLEFGKERMKWFRANMPILTEIEENLRVNKPFEGLTIAICMHIEPKTGYWIEGLLKSNPTHIYLVGCLGTTKSDTAAFLDSLDKVTVLGSENDSYRDHVNNCEKALSNKVDILLDNGGSLIRQYYTKSRDYVPIGANEETRSGRLLIEKENIVLDFPVIVIDDSPLKRLLENAIGVGQSVVDGFMRSTSLLVGGKNVLVIGYGFCGSGVAEKFKGLGANTFVYDKDPLYMLKAKTEGHMVGRLNELIKVADVIITVTGEFDVINISHLEFMKDGCILANSGHFGFEIDVVGIKSKGEVKVVKSGIEEVTLLDKSVFILNNAAPLNLSAGDGNPIEIMDLGLGLQSLSAIRLVESKLDNGMQNVPSDISRTISKMSLGIKEPYDL